MDPDPPDSAAPRSYRLSLADSLAEVPAADWDRLLGPDDAPLLAHGYLYALEVSGCVSSDNGWRPAHLLLHSQPEDSGPPELCAAAPAYLKSHSDGEWVYDLEWAALAGRLRRGYYPKLVLAVPFNPVTGRRVLTPPQLAADEQERLAAVVLRGAGQLCRQLRIPSLHALFPRASELPALQAAGLSPRRQAEQYHFINRGYGGFDDFLADLRHNRRRTIRKERQALREAGITVRTHRGLRGHVPDVQATPAALQALEAGPFELAELDLVHSLYEGTSQRYTGEPPYLSRDHFRRCAASLGDRVELVLARDQQGTILAGAFNLRGDTRLYGRHWGEATHVPGLHFEVCLYHGIERCIALGLHAYEPGHGGDQKLLRGFAPVYTYSAHALFDAVMQRPLQRYLELEAPLVDKLLHQAQRRCPLKRLPDPADPRQLAPAAPDPPDGPDGPAAPTDPA